MLEVFIFVSFSGCVAVVIICVDDGDADDGKGDDNEKEEKDVLESGNSSAG